MPVTKLVNSPPPRRFPTWLMFALPVSAIALALLGYLAYAQWQQQMVEQYICIPHKDSPQCQSLRPQFVPRNML